MRVGVLTFTGAQNWGAVLQGYSIQEFINSQTEHECTILDWEPVDNSLLRPYKTIPNLLHSIMHIQKCKKRVEKFQEFRDKYLRYSPRCYTHADRLKLNQKYGAFIVGSDQVWSTPGHVNPIMFLDFADDTSRKISYAPSFGASHIAEECEEELKKYIEDFDSLSIRERSGRDIIHRFSQIQVDIVADPVFLQTAGFWRNLSVKPNVKERYIFVYPTQITEDVCKAVKTLKKISGLPVYTPFYISGCHTIKDMGIEEFLGWIDHADHILATSFHATAFSILFEKSFWAIPHTTTGARIMDLLENLQIDRMLLPGKNSINIDQKIDYTRIRPSMEHMAEYSRKWLKSSLE